MWVYGRVYTRDKHVLRHVFTYVHACIVHTYADIYKEGVKHTHVRWHVDTYIHTHYIYILRHIHTGCGCQCVCRYSGSPQVCAKYHTLQHTSTHICKTHLQQSFATHIYNIHLQHTLQRTLQHLQQHIRITPQDSFIYMA